MKACCLMMQKDEDLLLEHWVRYHAALLGADNLIIFDNGSESPLTQSMLRHAEQIGVQVDYSKRERSHFQFKGRVIRDAIRRLESDGKHDFYIPLDCDEFLALARSRLDVRVNPESILAELETYRADPAVLTISGAYLNVPGKTGEYTFFRERKCFFAAGSVATLDRGFHHGTSRSSDDRKTTRITHIHYRFKPLPTFLEHARRKLEPTIRDFEADTLASYSGPGQHLIPYFGMTEDQYHEACSKGQRITIPRFIDALRELGLSPPYV